MKIDFYILETANKQQSLLFACQLLEKFHSSNSRVFINTVSLEEAERLDNLLWTFKDDSFIPHGLYDANDKQTPIQIGFNATPEHHDQILFNLTANVPNFYQQFQQVIEIVFADSETQQLARERYKQYRDHGHDIQTIKSNA